LACGQFTPEDIWVKAKEYYGLFLPFTVKEISPPEAPELSARVTPDMRITSLPGT